MEENHLQRKQQVLTLGTRCFGNVSPKNNTVALHSPSVWTDETNKNCHVLSVLSTNHKKGVNFVNDMSHTSLPTNPQRPSTLTHYVTNNQSNEPTPVAFYHENLKSFSNQNVENSSIENYPDTLLNSSDSHFLNSYRAPHHLIGNSSYTPLLSEDVSFNSLRTSRQSQRLNPYQQTTSHETPHIGESFRDRKFSKKIYVTGFFPPHIRPASVLIGTRGMNHHRMQSSGCSIQLRGKGCSQPNFQWSEEPIHLYVKYDTETQFNRFHEIFNEIVQSCQEEANHKRGRWENQNRIIQQEEPRSKLPVDHDAFALQVDLLFLLQGFFKRTKFVYLDELFQTIVSEFGIDVLQKYLRKQTPQEIIDQLLELIKTNPHLFQISQSGLQTGAGTLMTAPSNRLCVFFDTNALNLTKTMLAEYHRNALHNDLLKAQETIASTHPQMLTSNSLMKSPSPFFSEQVHTTSPHLLAAQHLLVQALHFIIHKRPDHCCTVENIQNEFKKWFSISLDVSALGFCNVVDFIIMFPNAFSIEETPHNKLVFSLPNPQFSLPPSPPTRVEMKTGNNVKSFPTSSDTAQVLVAEQQNLCIQNSTTKDDQGHITQSLPQEINTFSQQHTTLAQHCFSQPLPTHQPSSFISTNTKPKSGTNVTNPTTPAPRLLGLLSRLVEQNSRNGK